MSGSCYARITIISTIKKVKPDKTKMTCSDTKIRSYSANITASNTKITINNARMA